MLVLLALGWTVFVSLSASSASAMSRDEKGPSNVAALGFLILRSFRFPTNEVVLGWAVVRATATGLIGVAGASCGAAATGGIKEGATALRLPMLRIAGSTKVADCVTGG
jgi:hypothetical protein